MCTDDGKGSYEIARLDDRERGLSHVVELERGDGRRERCRHRSRRKGHERH